MVGRDYELEQMPAPPKLRRWFDQQAIPMAIDGAATIEILLEGLAQRAERRPLPLLGYAFAFGVMTALLVPRGSAPRS